MPDARHDTVGRNDAGLAAAIPHFALIGAGIASTVVLLTLPVFVGGIVTEHGWADTSRGWIAAADMAGSAVASLAVLQRMSRLPWRRAALLAIAVSIAANLACIRTGALPAMLALRFTCGLGCGVVLSIAFTGLCHSRDPERWFGAYVLAQLLLQTLLLALLPDLIERGGMRDVYLAFAGCLALAGLAVWRFPSGFSATSDKASVAPAESEKRKRITKPVRIALAGQAAYFLAMSALWSYYEGIGSASSLDLRQIGAALAAGSVAGIGGAAAAVALGARLAVPVALFAGTALSVAAAGLLAGSLTPLRFAASACAFNFAWNFAFPYQMGALSRLDREGPVAVASLLVQLSGLAIGPGLAALAMTHWGYGILLAGCVAGFLAGLAFFLRSLRA